MKKVPMKLPPQPETPLEKLGLTRDYISEIQKLVLRAARGQRNPEIIKLQNKPRRNEQMPFKKYLQIIEKYASAAGYGITRASNQLSRGEGFKNKKDGNLHDLSERTIDNFLGEAIMGNKTCPGAILIVVDGDLKKSGDLLESAVIFASNMDKRNIIKALKGATAEIETRPFSPLLKKG